MSDVVASRLQALLAHADLEAGTGKGPMVRHLARFLAAGSTRGATEEDLADLVQDVWEHVLGPEATVDEAFVAEIRRFARGRALDFGAGAGFFTWALVQGCHPVHVVEPNPLKNLFLSSWATADGWPRVPILRDEGGPYDTVVAINVLDHLPRPARAVEDLAGCMPSGATLLYAAAFPDDGVHTGGLAVRERVFAALRRHFDVAEAHRAHPHRLEILEKRETPRSADGGSLSWAHAADLVPHVHHALRVQPVPDRSDEIVLGSDKFYVRPVHATVFVSEVLDACRHGRSLADVVDRLETQALERREVEATIETLVAAHLLTLETRRGR